MTEPRIFAFWTGDTPLSDNRKRGLDTFGRTGLEPTFVTARNLSAWVVSNQPLHPAYELLSPIHRSDYLRAYFMYHYGGGYADVKPQTGSWLPSVERVESSDHLIGAGYREIRGGAPNLNADTFAGQHYVLQWRTGRAAAETATYAMRVLRPIMIGNGAFYFKRGQPMVKQWLSEAERRLDALLPVLRNNPPAHPRDKAQDGQGYPVPWAFLMGSILGPLSILNVARLDKGLPVPIFKDYF
nr:glycosyltransferase [uncultured Sphingomonas sp.]